MLSLSFGGAASLRAYLPLLVCALASPLLAQSLQASEVASLPLDVASRYDLLGGTLQTLQVPDRATACLVDVTLDGRERTLKLWPHDVRADDFQLLVEDETGIHAVPTPQCNTLRGRILGEPDSRIAGSLWDGKLTAMIWESVNDREAGAWVIQPEHEFQASNGLHVVYHETQSDEVPGTCGVDTSATMTATTHRQFVGGGAGPVRVCEIACDADNQYYNLLLQDVVLTQNDITSIINATDFIYLRDVAITYEVTTILVRTSEPDPYTSSNPGNLLGQFRDHWNAQQQGIQRDIAHLFTGRDLNGGVIGVAWLGVICTNNLPYGLSESRYTGNFPMRVSLTAHELGHNWSSPHCNGSSGCQIMCASNGGCGGVTAFGPDAAAFIVDHKNSRSCLSDPFPPSLSSVSPTTIQAFGGGAVNLVGQELSNLTAIHVGSATYNPAEIFVQVLDENNVRISPFVGEVLGQTRIPVENQIGTSGSVSLDVTEVTPPVLAGPPTAVTGAQLTYVTGSKEGDQWFLFAAVNNPVTAPFQGFDILVGSTFTGFSGTTTGVGIDTAEVFVFSPSFVGSTVYLHSLVLDEQGFVGATNIRATTFIL